MSYKKDIEIFRYRKDEYMKKDHHSPLRDHKIREKFDRLDYYPIDERWNFKVILQRFDKMEKIQMETSTGEIQNYDRLGFFEFVHPDTDEEFKINLYKSGDHYTFIIRDLTSGEETYGAGRYMNIQPERDDPDMFVIDFNMLYSPFCAYSTDFNCPFPPLENWLQVKITAGEKNFPLAEMVH